MSCPSFIPAREPPSLLYLSVGAMRGCVVAVCVASRGGCAWVRLVCLLPVSRARSSPVPGVVAYFRPSYLQARSSPVPGVVAVWRQQYFLNTMLFPNTTHACILGIFNWYCCIVVLNK